MTKTKSWIVSSSTFVSIVLIGLNSIAAKRSRSVNGCEVNLVQKVAPTSLPAINPVIAKTLAEPFDDPRYIFEMKYDGFRGIAYFERGKSCRILSRNGKTLTRFRALCEAIASELKVKNAIFDGEVIAFDPTGRPIFDRLLRGHGPLHYVAFDLLWLNGKDLRSFPLKVRRERLIKVLPQDSRFITESLAEVGNGVRMFNLMVEHDLEGVVAKRLEGKYSRATRWYKIKNKSYSQAVGRSRFFRERK